MKFYDFQLRGLHLGYTGTLTDAHKECARHVKNKAAKGDEMDIIEVEVPTSKSGILDLLNGEAKLPKNGRRWYLTDRGGLKEDFPIED